MSVRALPFVAFQTLFLYCTARNENHGILWNGDTWSNQLAMALLKIERRRVRRGRSPLDLMKLVSSETSTIIVPPDSFAWFGFELVTLR